MEVEVQDSKTPRYPCLPILLIDDEAAVLRFEKATLEAAGLDRLLLCEDGRQALDLIESHNVGVVLLDVNMPEMSGEEVLADILERCPHVAVIMVSGQRDLACAVRCMKLGAVDYLEKPISATRLVEAVRSANLRVQVLGDLQEIRAHCLASRNLENPAAFADILTTDRRMLEMFHRLENIAKGSHPVFIAGETGTGKELVARALHACSGCTGKFVPVNVAGLDENMFADVLFGHRRGAFTGATSERRGMIEEAVDGTLFLDEIGDLSEGSQVRLLRVLQEKEYYPHGCDRPLPLRSRIVTATHQDPANLRQDFYFRLRSYRIDVPPLRERLCDLPILVDHFLRMAAKDLGKPKPAVPAELFIYLSNYDYPGNLRELQSVVFGAMARHEHGPMRLELFLEHLPKRCAGASPSREFGGERSVVLFPQRLPNLREIQDAAIREALERTQGNLSAAARLLGISRPTIQRSMKRELDTGEVRAPRGRGSAPIVRADAARPGAARSRD